MVSYPHRFDSKVTALIDIIYTEIFMNFSSLTCIIFVVVSFSLTTTLTWRGSMDMTTRRKI